MPQQKILCFGVRGGALPCRRDPSPANLHAMMGAIDVAVARAPNSSVAWFFDEGEGQGNAARLLIECRIDVSEHLVWRAHGNGNPAPELLIEPHGGEIGLMRPRKRFEAHVTAFEGHRSDDHFCAQLWVHAMGMLQPHRLVRGAPIWPGAFGGGRMRVNQNEPGSVLVSRHVRELSA